jgi:hypothetical protein
MMQWGEPTPLGARLPDFGSAILVIRCNFAGEERGVAAHLGSSAEDAPTPKGKDFEPFVTCLTCMFSMPCKRVSPSLRTKCSAFLS